MDRTTELTKLTTFDLAFNLATGKFKTEEDKFIALDIIKSREANPTTAGSTGKVKDRNKKPPLKGSKAEYIQKLIDKKMSAKDIFDFMNDKKNKLKWKKTYYPEIYRLINASK